MESNWATEHLQAIRTLMERAAVYRRALAPIMLLTGIVGLSAASMGWLLKIDSPGAFIAYWIVISLLLLLNLHLKLRAHMELITVLARELAIVNARSHRSTS